MNNMKKVFSKSIEYLAAVSMMCAKVLSTCFALTGAIVFIDPYELAMVEEVGDIDRLVRFSFMTCMPVWIGVLVSKAIRIFETEESGANRWKQLLSKVAVYAAALALVFLAVYSGGTETERIKIIFALVLPGVAIRIVQHAV